MNLQKISATAEIVSSAAILVTLIYLTIETEQNTDAMLAISRQDLLSADLQWLENSMAYPEVLLDPDEASLSVADRSRATSLMISFLRIREFAWFQYQNGVLDEESWQSYTRPIFSVFDSDLSEIVLNTYRGDPEFVAYVRNMLREGE
jgi:hypothetical protein